jgi:hypothetical protein
MAVGLRVVLTNRAGVRYGEVYNPSDRAVSRAVKAPRTARFSVAEGHPMRAVLRQTSNVLAKVYDEDETFARTLKFVGPITAYQANANDEGMTVAIGATGPESWLPLRRARRFTQASIDPTAAYQRGQLMGWLIDALNAGRSGVAPAMGTADMFGPTLTGDTGIRPRTIGATTAGLFPWSSWLWTPASSVFADLAVGLNGPDWHVYPVEPVADGLGVQIGALDVANVIGVNRPNVSFEFGYGKTNVESYGVTIDPMLRANNVTYLPPGFPASSPIGASLSDAASIAADGPYEDAITGEFTDATLQTQLVNDHLAVRAAPRKIITFTVMIDVDPGDVNVDTRRLPRPGVDYDIGDIVRFSAMERVPVFGPDGAVLRQVDELAHDVTTRVYGIEEADDVDGRRQVTLTTVAT